MTLDRTGGMPELACYGLAGHTDQPADLLDEVRLAERARHRLGLPLRAVQRQGRRRAGRRGRGRQRAGIGIATAATNHNTRHPLVTATMATTLHRLSGGRYALGLGRGFDLLFDVMGAAPGDRRPAGGRDRHLPRGCGTAEAVRPRRAGRELPVPLPGQLLRRGHPGADDGDRRRRALELAGRVADGVVLHTFLTDETLARVGRHHPRARRARPAATRRPCGSGRCSPPSRSPSPRSRGCASWSAGWRPTSRGTARCWCGPTAGTSAALERFRDDPLVQGYPGAFDAVGTVEELTHLRDDVLPARVARPRRDRLGRRSAPRGSRTSSTPARTA